MSPARRPGSASLAAGAAGYVFLSWSWKALSVLLSWCVEGRQCVAVMVREGTVLAAALLAGRLVMGMLAGSSLADACGRHTICC